MAAFGGLERLRGEHRAQFFGLAAQAMRRILVDRARLPRIAERGGVASGEV